MSQLYQTMKSAKRKTVALSKKEFDLMYFLWRWKLTTTPAIYKKFYNHLSPHQAYKRLRALEKDRFISFVRDSSGHYRAWTLTKKAYEVIQYKLPFLESDGFKSENIGHDLVVTTAHQGPWIIAPPNNVQIATEQELRRYEKELLPKWIPNPKEHRPDGYWAKKINGEWHIVSLEVELSRKLGKNYEIVGGFYKSYPALKKVLWLVPTITTAKWMLKNLLIGQSKNSTHNFALLDPYLDQGWNAKIVLGPNSGHSIFEMLCVTLQEDISKWMGDSRDRPPANFLLDSRKSPCMLGTYQNPSETQTGVSSSKGCRNNEDK